MANKSKWTHDGLTKKIAHYFLTTGDCKIVCAELHSELKEIPDVYCVYRHFSVVCEIKVSRKDFFKDAKKSFRKHPKDGLGTYRYYACPADMIKIEELPPKWGLIYAYEDGKVKMIKGKAFKHKKYDNEHIFQVNYKNENKAMYSLLRRAASWGMGETGYWEYNKEETDLDDIFNTENTPRIIDEDNIEEFNDNDFYVEIEEGEDIPLLEENWEELISLEDE